MPSLSKVDRQRHPAQTNCLEPLTWASTSLIVWPDNPVTHFYDKPEPMDSAIPGEHREILDLLETYPDGITVAGLGAAYIDSQRPGARAWPGRSEAAHHPNSAGTQGDGTKGRWNRCDVKKRRREMVRPTRGKSRCQPAAVPIRLGTLAPTLFKVFSSQLNPGVFPLALHPTLGMVGRGLTGQDTDRRTCCMSNFLQIRDANGLVGRAG